MVYALKIQQYHYCPEHAEDAEMRLNKFNLCLQNENSEQTLSRRPP